MDPIYLSIQVVIVAIDYFSRIIEFSEIKDKTAETVTLFFKQIFARHGMPLEIIADNNPFNLKRVGEFCSQYNCRLTTSSPRHAQSNGMS